MILTIEWIDKKNHNEGYCICIHNNENGIIKEIYDTLKDNHILKLLSEYKIEKIVDYTKKC